MGQGSQCRTSDHSSKGSSVRERRPSAASLNDDDLDKTMLERMPAGRTTGLLDRRVRLDIGAKARRALQRLCGRDVA